jgi:aromatic-L-amino-acid decarboxylase
MKPEEADRLNAAILDRVNATGEIFISHTVLRGRFCLRVALGNLKTRREHVEAGWALLREAAAGLLRDGRGA